MGPARHGPPPVTMIAHGDYIYVLQGRTLSQFSAATLELVKEVSIGREPMDRGAGRGPADRGSQHGAQQ